MNFRQVLIATMAATMISSALFPLSANAATTVSGKFANWASAARELGVGGGLYQPQYRAGLKQDGPIEVLAFGGGSNPARPYAQTSAAASFGNTNRNFIIDQKWANTKWAASPTVNPARRPVGKVKLTLDSGAKVSAIVYANCNVAVADESLPTRKKCLPRHVLAFGGSLEFETPASWSTSSQARNDVVIRSRGLSYAQLLKIASGLEKVS